jgi:opacity protein-like surface antigen
MALEHTPVRITDSSRIEANAAGPVDSTEREAALWRLPTEIHAMNRLVVALMVALMAICFSAVSRSDNPLNVYVGGAVGWSNVQLTSDNNVNTFLYDGFHQTEAGWKALVGMRPIPLIGAELQYVDFGTPSDNNGNDVHQQAAAVYGLLYAPVPVPLFDVYAKAGLAWLRTNADTRIFATGGPCQDAPCGTFPFSFSRNDADFAFGAGVQFKFSKLAIRGEYERVQGSDSKPDMFSLGLTWTF